MVYCQISPDMKQRALQLLEQGWDPSEITHVLLVLWKSIMRWHDNYKTHGNLNPPSLPWEPCRLLTTEAAEELQDLILKSPELYLSEIREWLALYHDLPISTTALHNNLQDLGLTQKIMQHAAAECDHAQRTNWMLDVNAMYTADQMVVLDKPSKDGQTLIQKYGHTDAGHDPVITTSLNRGTWYSILPALTISGYIAVHAVEGSIDGAEFFDFVVNIVVCSYLKSLQIYWPQSQ